MHLVLIVFRWLQGLFPCEAQVAQRGLAGSSAPRRSVLPGLPLCVWLVGWMRVCPALVESGVPPGRSVAGSLGFRSGGKRRGGSAGKAEHGASGLAHLPYAVTGSTESALSIWG